MDDNSNHISGHWCRRASSDKTIVRTVEHSYNNSATFRDVPDYNFLKIRAGFGRT